MKLILIVVLYTKTTITGTMNSYCNKHYLWNWCKLLSLFFYYILNAYMLDLIFIIIKIGKNLPRYCFFLLLSPSLVQMPWLPCVISNNSLQCFFLSFFSVFLYFDCYVGGVQINFHTIHAIRDFNINRM